MLQHIQCWSAALGSHTIPWLVISVKVRVRQDKLHGERKGQGEDEGQGHDDDQSGATFVDTVELPTYQFISAGNETLGRGYPAGALNSGGP